MREDRLKRVSNISQWSVRLKCKPLIGSGRRNHPSTPK